MRKELQVEGMGESDVLLNASAVNYSTTTTTLLLGVEKDMRAKVELLRAEVLRDQKKCQMI